MEKNRNLENSPFLDKYEKKLREYINNKKCIICNEGILNGNILVNGEEYHEDCYNKLLNEANQIEKDIDSSQSLINQRKLSLEKNIKLIHKSRGLLNKFKTAIGTTYIDEKVLYQERKKIENDINDNEEQIIVFKEKLIERKKLIEYIYDNWPGYPPDWERRSNEIREERRVCEACGNIRRLHVHHRNNVKNGGNHKRDNLVLLCEECHGEIHHQDFRDKEFDFKDGVSSFGKKLKLINQAISQEQKIFFHYTKRTGEKTKRTIEPQTIKRVGHSLCVKGFCYLRNDGRTFAIKRMRQVKLE
ncbi:MAG: WYL domain-containing protein [Promethearchaeota archaeon]